MINWLMGSGQQDSPSRGGAQAELITPKADCQQITDRQPYRAVITNVPAHIVERRYLGFELCTRGMDCAWCRWLPRVIWAVAVAGLLCLVQLLARLASIH